MGYNDIYRIAALIVKSIKGKESEEERNELDAWRNASDRNRRLYQKYQDAEYFRARSIVKEYESSERIWKSIKTGIAKKKKRALLVKVVSCAAVFALLLSAGALWIIQSDAYQFECQDDMTAIKAGDSKAILSLVDGSEYCLNSRIRLALIGENYAIRDEAGTHIIVNKKEIDTKKENKLFVPNMK